MAADAITTRTGSRHHFDSFDGLWASPGSPYKSFDGMLKGIEYARVNDRPFLGTCGGFQYTLIECARNVLGIRDATTAEEDPKAKNIVIYPVACAVPNRDPNAPKLSGKVNEIRLRPGSFLAAYYGKEMIEEEFFCNYEMNPEFEWMAMEAGFPIVARGSKQECRALNPPRTRFSSRHCFNRNFHREGQATSAGHGVCTAGRRLSAKAAGRFDPHMIFPYPLTAASPLS